MGLAQLQVDETSGDAAGSRLMDSLSKGDPAAMESLVEAYHDRIFLYLHRWLGNWEDARDVTQEVFVRLWQKAGQYNARYPLTPWIYRIAFNLCQDHFRKKNARVHSNGVEFDDSFFCECSAIEPTPEEAAIYRELRSRTLGAVNQLPNRQRNVLKLRLGGYRLREIADDQGISVGTVKSTLYNAVERVRSQVCAPASSGSF